MLEKVLNENQKGKMRLEELFSCRKQDEKTQEEGMHEQVGVFLEA